MTTALVSVPLAFVATAPAQAAPITITLLDINDYHGRIIKTDGATDADTDTTVEFASTVERIRGTNPNTLLLSAGDNIGASLFASRFANDQPTIDVLNRVGVAASAVGNHEFDQGYDSFKANVLDGSTGYRAAAFDYLGANVYAKGTQNLAPGMKAFSVENIGGAAVCVIGAVTVETPSLVSPAGIANIDFGDPVAAVNRVSDQLDTAGTCDITVAMYHEGAPDGPTAATAATTADSAFGRIVQQTSGSVDVLYTGHTHQQYNLNLPKPGGGTRPVIQTGSYGERIGRVDLTVETTTDVVSGVTGSLVEVDTAELAGNQVVTDVQAIVDQAVADADVVGNVPQGKIAQDVTTAYSGGAYGPTGYAGGARDNRAAESSLGNLVADALRDTPITNIPGLPKPDIGVVNPGGLRDELLFAANGLPSSNSPQDGPGVVTYEEANAVLPFANNISYVTMTGAQFKDVLEQQWQTTSAGARPSRPFLNLGLSKNVQVVRKADTSATSPVGGNILSVTVDGKPLDPAKKYVVSTFSFLAAGGDNFRAFRSGSNRDTSRIDSDLWIDGYLKNGQTKVPSFARRQITATGIPASATVGSKISVAMSNLNLTSLGAPANTTVEAFSVQGSETRSFRKFKVVNGAATAAFKVPVSAGNGTVRLVAQPSGTALEIPVVKAESTLTAKKKPKKATTGVRTRIKVKVKAEGTKPRGAVKLFLAGKTYKVFLKDGKAVFKLPKFAKPGTKKLRVKYVGNTGVKADSKKIKLFVRRK